MQEADARRQQVNIGPALRRFGEEERIWRCRGGGARWWEVGVGSDVCAAAAVRSSTCWAGLQHESAATRGRRVSFASKQGCKPCRTDTATRVFTSLMQVQAALCR